MMTLKKKTDFEIWTWADRMVLSSNFPDSGRENGIINQQIANKKSFLDKFYPKKKI